MKRTRLIISLMVIAFCIVAFFSVPDEQKVEVLAICGGIIGTVASFYNYSEGKWPSSQRRPLELEIGKPYLTGTIEETEE